MNAFTSFPSYVVAEAPFTPITYIIAMKELTRELQLRKIERNKEIYYSKTMKLGQGAFGQVFLGFDECAHTPFACKIISLEKINAQNDQENIIKKIKDEIVNMQIARNEHIVEFYQAKTSERNIYIMCEYCNGDNLDRFLRNRGYLTEFEALGYFREILQGFYNLREKNIVHRDMKPANLLMHNYSLKIADLGFSKSIENHEQLLESMVGSPFYMSPQIFDHKKYTEKTDIWSVGAIFYEMLYGRNPFAGCKNIMELKERVKKEISFPSYPYVSAHTKNIIRRTMVVEEKDRLDWDFLFQQFLLKPPAPIEQIPRAAFYTLDNSLYAYFRTTYFIESQDHLHKLLKAAGLCSEEQLSKFYPFYETSQQFFSHIYFGLANKGLIREYFGRFIENRNEIAYLMVLCGKLGVLMSQRLEESLSVSAYCIYMLVFKYAIALIEQLITPDGQLIFDPKHQQVHDNFCQQKFLLVLLQRDRQLVTRELATFSPFFRAMLSGLGQSNPSLLGAVQTDLSGIYQSERGEKRVIKFFLKNYFRKIHNTLKGTVLAQVTQKASQMISEEEEREEKEEGVILPSIELIICRMMQEYLTNEDLFNLNSQINNQKLSNIQAPTFRKNLSQVLYDCQTSVEQGYFEQLSNSKPFQQESIVSFMSKEIRWNSIFLPHLQ